MRSGQFLNAMLVTPVAASRGVEAATVKAQSGRGYGRGIKLKESRDGYAANRALCPGVRHGVALRELAEYPICGCRWQESKADLQQLPSVARFARAKRVELPRLSLLWKDRPKAAFFRSSAFCGVNMCVIE